MKRINKNFIPALLISLWFTFPIQATPKPGLSLWGLNWLMGLLSIIWILAIICPLFINRKKIDSRRHTHTATKHKGGDTK
jgi:hypothetical protein